MPVSLRFLISGYRKLVLQWHPDKHPARSEAEVKIRQINAAQLGLDLVGSRWMRSGSVVELVELWRVEGENVDELRRM